MNSLPVRFAAMLEHGLSVVNNSDGEQHELRVVATEIANVVWQHWLAWRTPKDNRPEHEFVVFANVMRIAENEFSEEDKEIRLSKKRIATAFAFTHDTFPITRVTETMLDGVTDVQLAYLREEKLAQRIEHMEGGADNARFLLERLKHPETDAELLTIEEINKCVTIIERHDSWKLDPPDMWVPSMHTNSLAVVCLEADALWPLHPLGVLADLERPQSGDNLFESSDWIKELKSSLGTLQERYRPKWEEVDGIESNDFCDGTSIFQTNEGHRIYQEWVNFWDL